MLPTLEAIVNRAQTQNCARKLVLLAANTGLSGLVKLRTGQDSHRHGSEAASASRHLHARARDKTLGRLLGTV